MSSTVVAAAAVVATVVFAALAVLQLLVAAGKPYGRLVWGGGHRVLPAKLRIGSVIAVVLYTAFILVLLDRSGLLSVLGSGAFSVVAAWVLFAYFAIGIVVNAISRSKPERFTMTPVNAVLAACALVIAMS
jgi:preprotein translocase subunit SecY